MVVDLKPNTDLPAEQQAIRAKCFHPSGTFVEFKKEEIEQSIPERLEKIVRLYPHHPAVKAEDRSLTYTELNRAANRIACAILAMRGEGSEPIALLFEHGTDVIAAIFGVLKAGKFYVALDWFFPLERNALILEDSQARLIVTNDRNARLAHELASNSRELLNIDEISNSFSSENLGLAVAPDEIAHLIYTSGSTGEPKGVVHSHRTYLHRAMAYTNEMYICPDDRLSLLHSVSFGSSRLNLFQSPLTGACLFPFDVKAEGVLRLARWLKEERITICHLTPALFRQVADLFSGQENFPNLRVIHLSGEAITKRDIELYKKNFFPRTALRIYMGTTETVEVCSYVVEPDFSYPLDGVPVGYPVTGKKVFLLDENGHVVGPGEVGEIAVGTRYLAVGYWRRPELTNATFLPDPDGGDERIYLTGDLGRMLPGGFLVHLGRKDFVAKIRGYTVALPEIERVLLEHLAVKEAGVVAWDREPGEKYLAAYIDCHQPPAPAINELYGFLKEKLPDYMIPSAFVFVEALPLTNGKLDRKALPKPDDKRPELSQPYTPPQSEVERRLAQIWAEVLRVERASVHDNFFDLGGHSLLATQGMSRVREAFQVELPLRALFENPTVANLAVQITQTQAKKAVPEEMKDILADVESLSDEEAERLLAQESPKEI